MPILCTTNISCGLFNDEIAQCDIMVKIPTSESYSSLNLSHAVCLVLYVLYVQQKSNVKGKRRLGKIEKEIDASMKIVIALSI